MNGNLKVVLELINKQFNRSIDDSGKLVDRFRMSTDKAGKEVKELELNLTHAAVKAHRFKDNIQSSARTLGTIQGGITKASTGVAAFTGSMTGLISKGNLAVAGVVGVGAAITSTVSNAISKFKEFEQAMANFLAILGVSKDDMGYFEDQAIRLGAVTTLTSSLVAQSFTMIAGRLPLLLNNKEALVSVTQAAITLSEAAGITADEAGIALANSLNQMGASSAEANKYINILAAGSRNGAGDIIYLTEAMKKIGSTTASVGMTFELTVSAIEMLAKTGVVAGSAGRLIRGVIATLEKLMDENLKPSIVGADKAFENLGKRGLTTADYFNMFGKENANAARTLAETSKEALKLTETITGTSTATDQATIRTNTLEGAYKRLDSAYEALTLSVTGGDMWKNFIDGSARVILNLEKIISKWKDIEKFENREATAKVEKQWSLIQGRTDLMITNYTHTTNPETGKNYSKKEAIQYVSQNYKDLMPEYGLNVIDTSFKVVLDNKFNEYFDSISKSQEKVINNLKQFTSEIDKSLKSIMGVDAKVQYLENLSKTTSDPEQLFYIEELLSKYKNQSKEPAVSAEQLYDFENDSWINMELKGFHNKLKRAAYGLDPLPITFQPVVIDEEDPEDMPLPDVKQNDNKILKNGARSANDYAAALTNCASAIANFNGQKLEDNGEGWTQWSSNLLAAAASTIIGLQSLTMAKGVNSAFDLPFPANLAAAALVLSTVISLFASIPAFAEGGIFESTLTTGDRNIARLNGGEMILNKGQQYNLFKLLDNGSSINGGGEVTFKLRGSDIYGSLTNYNKKFNKVR